MFSKTLSFICWVGLVGLSIEPLVLGGFVANWLFHEPRPIKQVINDLSTTNQISYCISQSISKKKANIRPVSYYKHILLLGQTESNLLKNKVYEKVRDISGSKQVINQITLEPPKKTWQSLHDKYLSYKIRAKILLMSGIRYHQLKVVVENKEVFLLGQLNSDQIEQVTYSIQQVKGVAQIKRLIYPEA